MRVRVATTVLGVTAAVLLAVPACSTDTTSSSPDIGSAARTRKPAATLSSAALEKRLLDEHDLGSGYLRGPERPTQHDDVTVVGCPALNKLGGDAATGGSLTFPLKAKATFTYADGSNSEVSEELYSDSPNKLSDGIGRIFDAMTGCPTYQVVAGGTAIDMASQKLTVPHGLGDEQWSQLLTFSTGGRSTMVKQTAIRDGSLLLIVSGSPALVDRHLDKALTKATATS
ncbi:hypothetical protein ACFW5D_17750 [Streptomyces sp. NPDC058770]|uniref:hypothetical protein n=1 Tax=Streptomyces sp. NPDC058770 TaxID=3346631 RepID=UPI0036D15CCE